MIDLSSLNPPQRDAVINTDGPLLVLAGAGSGKTKVLTYKIAFILDAALAARDNILAVTFTNKAAGEMKERVNRLVKEFAISGESGSEENMPWMGTFHSICVKILKRYGKEIGISSDFSIYDSTDQKDAIKDAMLRKNVSIKEFNPGAIHSYISSAKNELVGAEEYELMAQGYFASVVAKIYPEYQKVLAENNAMDFDDLLFKTVLLLKNSPSVLSALQDKFRYILVDEYQDTNHAQYVLINMLAQKHRNICVVGDDDQSIYAFRGANIRNILNFEKDYPETKVVKLEQNYRSTGKILEASYQVISKNKGRKDKKLWTENGDGENIVLYTATDEGREANWVVNTILSLPAGYDYNNIAVLYRTNAQSRNLEEAFINAGLPYKIVGGVGFYERKEIKDVIAYVKTLANLKDGKSLERIINTPRRGIGDKTVKDLASEALSKGQGIAQMLIADEHKGSKGIIEFTKILRDLYAIYQSGNILDLIKGVLEKTKYIEFLSDGTLENESRIENIKELLSVASKFEELAPAQSIQSFLEEVSLLEAVNANNQKTNAVTLMTIHASKGLEFEHVFVVGMEENLFPHMNSSLDESELEEERRLAYVAITRAKSQLYLTHAKRRRYFGVSQTNSLSRFVKDITEDLISREQDFGYDFTPEDDSEEIDKFSRLITKFEVGDKVKHEYFGTGIVKHLDSDIIQIDFGSVFGVKELMLEYARLEKVR